MSDYPYSDHKLSRQEICRVLLQRGWKWDRHTRYWVLEKHGVKITVSGMYSAFSLTVEKLENV